MPLVNGCFSELAGDGSPVVIVPGLGATTNSYWPIVQALAPHHRVLSFDLPGAGRSPLPPRPVSLDALTELVVDQIDSLDTRPVHLIGHSFGSLIAQSVAARAPERLRSLTLLGPIREQPTPAKQAAARRVEAVRRDGMLSVLDALVDGATSPRTRAERPVVVALIRQTVMSQDPEGYAQLAEALATSPAQDLARIRTPTCVLTGSEDEISDPSVAWDLTELLPNGTVAIIDGVGHWAHLEAPSEVLATVGGFLERHDSRDR